VPVSCGTAPRQRIQAGKKVGFIHPTALNAILASANFIHTVLSGAVVASFSDFSEPLCIEGKSGVIVKRLSTNCKWQELRSAVGIHFFSEI
jgi:hypothetical protein